MGTVAGSARLEKCYRAYGPELDLEHNLVEAGLARPRVKPQDFIGKEALLQQRATPPVRRLCTLTVDDNTSASGLRRYMSGREPLLTRAGHTIPDAHGRNAYVTSAGYGPSVGKHILLAYLPPDHAHVGAPLLVEYFGEHYPVTVAVVGATPLFDPENARMKA
jgi:glycine cleavage system aminomethyltransferase T